MANTSSSRKRRQPFDFHVLVIGRANAGKTTLLKRFCGTNEEPLVKRGGESDFHPQEQMDGTLERGDHDINDQYMFRNSPGLIFHDSCGLEAGSLKEKDNIKDFINAQASSTKYRNHVHVIWLCLPIDEARPLQDNELWLLDSGVHGRVPVIAILTKCDGLENKIWAEITQSNKDEDEDDEIELEVDRRLMGYIEEKKILLGSMKHAPQAVVWTTELQREEGAANTTSSQLKSLTDATFDALRDRTLRSMFAVVQRNNIWVFARSCYNGKDTTESWGSSTRKIVRWAMRATMVRYPHSGYYCCGFSC